MTGNKTMNTHETLYEAAIMVAGPIGLVLAVHRQRGGVAFLHFDDRRIALSITCLRRSTTCFLPHVQL